MKKTLRRSILFTLFLACVLIPLMGQRVLAADVAIDADSFPDDVFRSYVETFDTDHDGALSDAERNAVTAISCDGLGVKSISGVEQFEKLETLSLKNCTSLEYLPNSLGALDALVAVTADGCTALKQIYFSYMTDALKTLSARDCTALESCTFTPILFYGFDLDLTGCTALTSIDCSTTHFTSIIVDDCVNLTSITAACSGKLDLSACPGIQKIKFTSASSTNEVNLKNCMKLEYFSAPFSYLKGGLDLTDCKSLKELHVAYCEGLYSLDVTHCPQLEVLSCGNNHDITSLDVTHNPKLRELSCQTTGITALDVSKCPELTVLECGDQMTALDVSQNTKLKVLNCAANKLTSLDVSMLPDLAELNCNGNALTTLDVTANPELKTLYCRGNKLTTLDVTANPELKDLFCCDNNLATLDLRKTPFLNQHVLKGEEIIETGYPDYGKHIQYLYKGSKFENGVKVDKDTHILTAHCIVIWNDWDGTLLQSDAYFPVGIVPVYPDTNPTREADAQYTYLFDGWTPEPAPAESGINTYTAVFKTETNSYQITFVNWDGTELQSSWVDYGATPVYSGAEPEKPGTAQYDYTFKEWTPAIVPVTEDATYTAVFDETLKQYTVTWVIDGTSETETYAYGETPAHADPTKPATAQYNYTFKEWSPAIVPVTGDATYTAVFDESVRQYTVTWVIDGTSETETYTYGETPAHADPTKPATAQYNYTFKEWTPAIVPVTGNATYTAVFDATVCQYTVTWIIDGKKETEIYAYGETPAHKNPAKSAGPHFSYVFKEWTPAIVPVTEDATYTAVFYKDPVPKPVIPETPVFPFIDVTPDSPFYDDIVYVWENRLMNGMSDTIFGTNLPLTRGMIVTVLWRMEGSPAVDFSGVFTDVSAGAWYADGVEWAAAHGIVLGYGNRTYGPQDSVTREQLAAILFRYAKFKGYDVSIGENTNILSYDDALRISSWAFPAMQWACGTNVLNSGKTAAIRPAAPATRGEIAHAIHFFLEKTAK